MKKILTKITFVITLMTVIPVLALAQNSFFTNTRENAFANPNLKRVIVPDKYRTIQLDTNALLNFLKTIPSENNVADRHTAPVITIPMPDGKMAGFRIWESSTMAPELAARYPNLKTFTGQGITDPTATLKVDWTEMGFHAQILSPVSSAVYIDPYARGTLTGYISYFKKDFKKKGTYIELPPIQLPENANREQRIESTQCIGTQLRTYRLAVACTGEYAVAATGQSSPTRAQALSAIVTTVNRVDGIYETELDLRLVLVALEDSVVYTNAATDPFTGNNSASTLYNESQTVIDNRIGTANYDMGHTFSTGGGGLSGLGIICKAGQKAKSITGSPSPTGDGYDVDYVAHEMGHAVGGNHTFNSVTGSCSGNGVSTTNTEPGSGTTIMAYAGICGADDIQPHSDPQFQAINLDEISTYTFFSTGNTCGTLTNTGNTPPVVDAGANYIIPKSTPFILTGSATDANGDALTYSWEEIDKGGPYGTPNAPSGNAPLFRSFVPVTTPTRYFPKLSDVISNTTTLGEILPSYARTMRFRLTARDNRAGGSGVCFDSTSLLVDGTAAPFAVTAPTATGIVWYVNDFKTITWNASTTSASPISCANVIIQLSTDGGNTYPITLLSSTPNDGSEEIQVPNNISTTARVRVMALGNVFYDISNNNFTIQASPSADFVFNNPVPVTFCSGPNPSTVLKTGALSGFANPVTLSASGVPAGATISFDTNPVAPGNSSTVMLNNANTLASGTYNITITGVAGSVTKTRVIQFIVGVSVAPTLSSPANNASGQSFMPTLTWQAVSGTTGYNLLVSGSNTFADTVKSVVGITGTSYTFTTPLAQNTTYYWRVSSVNNCGAGAPSGSNAFRTGIVVCGDTLRSTNVPVTIPTTIATVTSALTVPMAAGGVINDVDVVGLKGTHTYISDLSFTIKSPAGTSVLLFGGVCGSNDNFDINLDDEATSGTIACPPTGGQVRRPTEALSKFDNENSTGTWTLSVADNFTGDGGSLTGWGLRICTLTSSPILPLSWLNFTAVKNADYKTVAARWQTANEVNNHHFELERSIDGRNFIVIGRIDAGHSAAGTQTYLFNDAAPVTGTNYYRVKQVDNDGKFTYSAVVTVVFSKGGALWSVYPNPAKDKTALYAKTNLNAVEVQITDVSGKILYRGYIPVLNTGQSVNIPLNNLSKGMYLLKIYSEKQTTTEKIMVQ